MYIVTANRAAGLAIDLAVQGVPGANPPTWEAVWRDQPGTVLGTFPPTTAFATGFPISVADMASISTLWISCTPNDGVIVGDPLSVSFTPPPVITPGGNPIMDKVQDPPTFVQCYFTP